MDDVLKRRLIRNPMVVTGSVILLAFVVIALASLVYLPHDPREVSLTARNAAPELFGRAQSSTETSRYW
ncbi:MAG: ABC transporter permease, partial [Candidatus Poribacteria bacterium]|nr:ABC transporter permease [Candidatus Poribacteria bacterium]